jgi:hypothetical protein
VRLQRLVGVTIHEEVARREAENAATLTPAEEDIKGLVWKVTVLEGELVDAR